MSIVNVSLPIRPDCRLTAVVPALKKDGQRTAWKPLKAEDSILVRYKNSPSSPDFMSLVNKTPKWNDQVGAYVLNFNGRVTMASVKSVRVHVHIDRARAAFERSRHEQLQARILEFEARIFAIDGIQHARKSRCMREG